MTEGGTLPYPKILVRVGRLYVNIKDKASDLKLLRLQFSANQIWIKNGEEWKHFQ